MIRPARFLVLRGGAIGDFIVTLPVFSALRARWPDSYIEVIGYPHIARLAEVAGLVDRVRGLDTARMARFFGRRPTIDEATRQYLASFDCVLSYLHDPDGLVAENLTAAGVRRLLYRSPLGPSEHIVDHLLRPLESLAIYERGAVPRLPLTERFVAEGRACWQATGLTSPPVVIHPGSGGRAKIWPWEGFREVARFLRDQSQQTLLFLLGEADHELRARVAEAAAELNAPWIEGLSLLEVASLLSASAGYLGNDSGITHLAAAVGIPVVALFGPTDPTIWGPRGPRVHLVTSSTGTMAGIRTEEVLEAVKQALRMRDRAPNDPEHD